MPIFKKHIRIAFGDWLILPAICLTVVSGKELSISFAWIKWHISFGWIDRE